MVQRIDATFENGVFRPDAPLDIADGQRFSLSFQPAQVPSEIPDDISDVADLLDLEFMQQCANMPDTAPSLEEVRAILGRYKGSLADLISEDRDER